MTEQYVKLVMCSPERCDNCHNSRDGKCSVLAFAMEGAEQLTPIIVERERGSMYIPVDYNAVPSDPPWYSGDWEQVWIDNTMGKNLETHEVIDVYIVGSYVSIFTQAGCENEICYFALPKLRSHLESALLDKMTSRIPELSRDLLRCTESLTHRVRYLQHKVYEKLEESLPEISIPTRSTISQIAGHSSTVLFPIIPLLLDDEIEEIFIDSPGSQVYFDHARLGRCKSDWVFPRSAIRPMVTLARLESNHHLDRRNPSFKSRMGFLDANLRVSMAVMPLCPDGFQMQIRRARREIMTLFHLIRNETISAEGAALLILALRLRQNIVITGGPGTGKSTLLNALDQITPSIWRKIYIEDAIESRIHQNQHQTRIQVDPLDEMGGVSDKTREIVKSLHRSPDYVILGEIQTEEHSHALFHALSAGLRCANTCHSDSASSLISRFRVNHHIVNTNLAMLDLIVTMRRPKPGDSRRYVSEIVEVRRGTKDGCIEFRGLNILYSNNSNAEVPNRIVKDGAVWLRCEEDSIEDFNSVYMNLVARLGRMKSMKPCEATRHLQEQTTSCLGSSSRAC